MIILKTTWRSTYKWLNWVFPRISAPNWLPLHIHSDQQLWRRTNCSIYSPTTPTIEWKIYGNFTRFYLRVPLSVVDGNLLAGCCSPSLCSRQIYCNSNFINDDVRFGSCLWGWDVKFTAPAPGDEFLAGDNGVSALEVELPYLLHYQYSSERILWGRTKRHCQDFGEDHKYWSFVISGDISLHLLFRNSSQNA